MEYEQYVLLNNIEEIEQFKDIEGHSHMYRRLYLNHAAFPRIVGWNTTNNNYGYIPLKMCTGEDKHWIDKAVTISQLINPVRLTF